LCCIAVVVATLSRSGDEETADGPMSCATDSIAKSVRSFGTAADNVALQHLDHTPVMLHDLAEDHRYIVLVFCSYLCPCSDGYAGRLRALHESYQPRGVAFYGVHASANETIEGMKHYLHRTGYPLPVFRDPVGAAADLFGATITPEVFIFDQSWVLQYHGRIDDDKSGKAIHDRSLQSALDTLLSGGTLAVKEKISRGCAIVREAATPPQ
jgi:hypothetical protein